MLGRDLALGVTVYGNGGMNTRYPGGRFNCGAGPATANVLCGGGDLGVDLMQLIVAPTVAYKLNPAHSVGISPLLVYQQFKAYGLQAFDNPPGFPPLSGGPGKVTNAGYDRSTGLGVRLGYQGHFTRCAQRRRGLFAQDQDGQVRQAMRACLPAPAASTSPTTTVWAWRYACPAAWTVALDYQRINYSGVIRSATPAAIARRSAQPTARASAGRTSMSGSWACSGQATPSDAARRHQQGQQPDPAARRQLQHHRPGTGHPSCDARGHLRILECVGNHVAYMNARRQSVSGTSFFDALMGPGAGGQETIRMRRIPGRAIRLEVLAARRFTRDHPAARRPSAGRAVPAPTPRPGRPCASCPPPPPRPRRWW